MCACVAGEDLTHAYIHIDHGINSALTERNWIEMSCFEHKVKEGMLATKMKHKENERRGNAREKKTLKTMVRKSRRV